MNYNHSSHISRDFSNLLKNPVGYNVKIKISQNSQKKEFRAHSIILCSRTKIFYGAFRETEYEDGIITFKKDNVSPLIFEVLLKYIYTGILAINNNSLVDIIVAAKDFGLPKVVEQLETHLHQNELAWKFPKDFISFQHDQFPNLSKYSLDWVCNHPKILFESKYFLKVKEDILIQLLKRDDLKLEEIEIWEYLIKWGIENTDYTLDDDLSRWLPLDFMKLESTLRNCIPHIRFFHMSPEDYIQTRTQFRNVIPEKLDDKIINYFFDSKSDHPFNEVPLRASNYPLDSNIIKAKDAALISSWIDRKQEKPYRIQEIPFEFKLIYRSSREGFDVCKFHEYCDNKGSTIVIIKVRDSREIIGGYNPLGWNDTNKYNETSYLLSYDKNVIYKTSNSFIFSITNRAIPILSRISSENEAIYCNKKMGPCFGLKDLFVNGDTGDCKRHSYEKKIIDIERFEIEEYEIFQIIEKRLSSDNFRYTNCSVIVFIVIFVIIII
ncbi:hypothetical protein RirG_046100 [Rhizophagus irregularis DAOM 197198w]|uniref:Serine-enriched protein n=1 Tax=Rhizophagus irregularis (strain DAOM 197198w) TaxID=1432141 RepID=A0A015K5U1_RHIIW|nr:hypothetical protein RirG_046100 [Rhizophagus irregularis DAOM 197198w]